jgi:hypothetical protein
MLLAGSLLGLLIDPEDGGSIFLQKHQYTSTALHSAKSKETVLLVLTAVWTSNPELNKRIGLNWTELN